MNSKLKWTFLQHILVISYDSITSSSAHVCYKMTFFIMPFQILNPADEVDHTQCIMVTAITFDFFFTNDILIGHEVTHINIFKNSHFLLILDGVWWWLDIQNFSLKSRKKPQNHGSVVCARWRCLASKP